VRLWGRKSWDLFHPLLLTSGRARGAMGARVGGAESWVLQVSLCGGGLWIPSQQAGALVLDVRGGREGVRVGFPIWYSPSIKQGLDLLSRGSSVAIRGGEGLRSPQSMLQPWSCLLWRVVGFGGRTLGSVMGLSTGGLRGPPTPVGRGQRKVRPRRGPWGWGQVAKLGPEAPSKDRGAGGQAGVPGGRAEVGCMGRI